MLERIEQSSSRVAPMVPVGPRPLASEPKQGQFEGFRSSDAMQVHVHE